MQTARVHTGVHFVTMTVANAFIALSAGKEYVRVVWIVNCMGEEANRDRAGMTPVVVAAGAEVSCR